MVKCPKCGEQLHQTGWGERQNADHPPWYCQHCKRTDEDTQEHNGWQGYWVDSDGKPTTKRDPNMPTKKCGLMEGQREDAGWQSYRMKNVHKGAGATSPFASIPPEYVAAVDKHFWDLI